MVILKGQGREEKTNSGHNGALQLPDGLHAASANFII